MIYILSLNDWDGSIDIVASKDLKKIRKYNAELLLEIRNLKKEMSLIKSELIGIHKNFKLYEEKIDSMDISHYKKLSKIELIDVFSLETFEELRFSINEIEEI